MKFSDLHSLGSELFPVKHDLEKLSAAIDNRNELQARAFVEKFDEIAEGRMSLWHFGNGCREDGTRFLLGVCPTWNLYDTYLLDRINDSLKSNPIKETLDIFDIDNVNNPKDLQKIFGIKVDHSPVLGIWQDGILQKVFCFWDAKNFLIEKFGIVWKIPELGAGEVLFIK